MRGFSDFSPCFATRRPGIRSRFVASTSCTALRRTAAHSSSVFGSRSSVPVNETMVATAFQRTSDSGSTIDVMMSLTVAVGLNWGCGAGSSRLLQPPAIRTKTMRTAATGNRDMAGKDSNVDLEAQSAKHIVVSPQRRGDATPFG